MEPNGSVAHPKKLQDHEIRSVFLNFKELDSTKFNFGLEFHQAELYFRALALFLLLRATKILDNKVKSRNYRARKRGLENQYTGYWQWSYVFILVIYELTERFGKGAWKRGTNQPDRVGSALTSLLAREECEPLARLFSKGNEDGPNFFGASELNGKRDRARKILAEMGVAQITCEWIPEIRITISRTLSTDDSGKGQENRIITMLEELRSIADLKNHLVSEVELTTNCIRIALDKRWAGTGPKPAQRRARRIRWFASGETSLAPTIEQVVDGWMGTFF